MTSMGRVMFKKGIVTISLILGLLLTANLVYGEDTNIDTDKLHIITEIGTLSNKGNYSQALDMCNKALKKYPKEPELYYWSATIKSELGNLKSAIEDYNYLIKLNSKDGNAYVMRGIAKSELADYDGAMADFNRAIYLNSKDSSAYLMRACLKVEIGDIEGASKDFDTANTLIDQTKKDK